MKKDKVLELVGKVADEFTPLRDAIHVAIAYVVADHILHPGTPLTWEDKQKSTVGSTTHDKAFAIVDPYLKGPVEKGQTFLAFLYPQTITDMEHVWKHPAFDAPVPRARNVRRVRPVSVPPTPPPVETPAKDMLHHFNMFVSNYDLDRDEALNGIKEFIETGEPYIERDSEDLKESWSYTDAICREKIIREVAEHFQMLIPPDRLDGSYPFSCSC